MNEHDQRTQDVRRIAQAFLAGLTGTIQTARLLRQYVADDDSFASTDDRNLLTAIDSETDDLPVGTVRAEWQPSALADKDVEIAELECLWRERLQAVCERILLRLYPLQ